MNRTGVVAFVAGLVFAIGLGVSGMTQATKVLAFLDVTGAWDLSLAFVMLGAIGVNFFFARRVKTLSAPLFAPRFTLPKKTDIDRRLLLGAALFGIGWGIAGFCPGPAIVSLATLTPATLAFVAAMLVAMMAYSLVFERDCAPLPGSDDCVPSVHA